LQEAAQHLRNAVHTLGQAFPQGNVDLVLALQDLANCLRMSMVEDAAQVTQQAYVSIRYVSIRQHTSAYVSIRQHTSAYVAAGFRQLASGAVCGGGHTRAAIY